MMTVRMLIQRLEMLDQSCEVFLAGDEGELQDIVQIDTHTVVLCGDIDDEEEEGT